MNKKNKLKKEQLIMKITPEIRELLQRALDYYGNTAQLAELFDVAHSTVYFWVRGKTDSISGKIWNDKVRPVLEEFRSSMDENSGIPVRQRPVPQAHAESPMMVHERPHIIYHSVPGTAQQSKEEQKKVPLISFAVLSTFDPGNTSLKRLVKQKQLESAAFACDCPDDAVAVRLGYEFPGLFLPGTDLLLATDEYPENGCCVLARMRTDGRVVFARYRRDGSWIMLLDMQSGAGIAKWDSASSLGSTIWMFPVLEARRDFRDEPELKD